MKRRIVVCTAYGACTSLGFAKESWRRICDGEIGIRRVPQWQGVIPKICVAGLVGQLPALQDVEPTLACWYKKEKVERRSDRSTQLAFYALGDMLRSFPDVFSGLCASNRFGIVCGPCLGGQQSNEEGYQLFLEEKHGRCQHTRVIKTMADAFCSWASIYFGATGYSSCCVTACATGLSNILLAAEKVQNGKAEVMLAGGFEGNTPFLTDSFAGAEALTPNPDPLSASRPFDLKRDGFVIGEGAAVVLLEDLQHALSRDAKPLAIVAGFAERCDAKHITQGDPEIQAQTIMEALENALTKPSDIQLVSAHATSTRSGDSCEAQALVNALAGHQPIVMATKANLGHTLGGTGAIEFVQSIQAIASGTIPAICSLTEPDSACYPDRLRFANKTTRCRITTVLTVNFGFGGKNAAAVIKAYPPA